MNDNNIILHIQMELCDRNLKLIIFEVKSHFTYKDGKTLTTVGYYVLSQLFIEMLESVKYLHENKIIHRDLNPCNIILKKDFRTKKFVKVIDFGLIAVHEFTDQSHSSERGNIDYIPPEAFEGNKNNTKADVYSLGVLLNQSFDIDMQT